MLDKSGDYQSDNQLIDKAFLLIVRLIDKYSYYALDNDDKEESDDNSRIPLRLHLRLLKVFAINAFLSL